MGNLCGASGERQWVSRVFHEASWVISRGIDIVDYRPN